MAANAQLIAVQITEIGTVVAGMIVRPETGRTLASGTSFDSSRVATVYGVSAPSEQRNHLPITRCRGLTIVGTRNQEEGLILTGLHPAGHSDSQARKT
jgi:hypothetical protein